MIQAPIIVDDHGDVLVFESVAIAERYLEPVDVENEEYVAFDSEGRKLDLIVEGLRVAVREGEGQPSQRVRLEESLRSFFEAIGLEKSWYESASLSELIEKGLEYKTE